jgi:uncharacterized membrane protein YdcZ (DUF606 family)
MNSKKSKIKSLMLVLSFITGIIFLLSIILQTSVIEMEHQLIEYASKHYFIIGLISFFIFTISFALFRALDIELTKRNQRRKNND